MIQAINPLGNPNVYEYLRIELQITRRLSQVLFISLQCMQHFQRGYNAVSSAVLVETDDVTGILTSQLPALLLQQLHHVAVTHFRAQKWDCHAKHRVFKSQIGHQRADHTTRQFALFPTMTGDDIQ